MKDKTMRTGLTRRQALTAMTASGAAALPFGAHAQPAAATRLLPGANVCVLTPESVEGPFYFDPKLERTDITEGKAGVPLGLLLQIVDSRDCVPVKGARVDVWHADALGYYSGYRGQSDARNVSTEGGHFLRGTQFTNESGQATFATIYPGWYRGRTAHIHCKVLLDDKTVLTNQLYFPDALSEYIYKNVKPYNTRALDRDTVNTTDGVLSGSGGDHASFCSVKEEADRYLASLIIGVDRNAEAGAPRRAGARPPAGPPPGGMGLSRSVSRPKGSLVPGIVKAE